MSFFSNLSLRNKLLLGALVPVVLFALVLSVLIRHLEKYEEHVSWVTHTHLVIEQAQHIEKTVVDVETGERGFLLTGLPEYLEPYEEGKKKLDKLLEEITTLVSDNPKQVLRLNQISLYVNKWFREVAEPEIRRRREFKKEENISNEIGEMIHAGGGKKLIDELRRRFKIFVDEEKRLLKNREKTMADQRRIIQTEMTGGLVLISLFVVSISWWIASGLLMRVNVLNKSISNVAAGNFDLGSGPEMEKIMLANDELGGLANSFKRMTESLKEVEKKNQLANWLSQGQEGLLDAIRNEVSVKELSNKMLEYLVPYTGATCGAVYVRPPLDLDDMDFGVHIKRFQLTACYGIEPENLSGIVNEGEGLLGSVAKSATPRLLTDFPDDYLVLSTSMGSFKPKEVLMFPLRVYGNVVALIELASHMSFEENSLSLIERTEDALATSITTVESQTSLADSNAMLTEKTRELQLKEEVLQSSNLKLEEKTRSLEEKSKEIEEASKALKVKADELTQASKYKSEFLANMSHELRTPLNSLLILSKYLGDNQEGNLTEDQLSSLEIIYSGGQELLAIINDILDLSKVEAGFLNITIKSEALKTITSNLNRQFSVVAGEKGIEFVVEHEAGLPEFVNVDVLRVTQILRNYLSNAFKFTKKGSVSLKIERVKTHHKVKRKDIDYEGVLCFSVTDTGIGIPKDRQKEVFEAFQQADGSTTRNYGGTGLGLTISRELAELMGGEIGLESEEGKGTTMYLYLPVKNTCDVEEDVFSQNDCRKKGEDKKEKSAIAKSVLSEEEAFELDPRMRGKHILLVDDDMRNVFSLKKLLNKNGFKVSVADNGKKALDQLERLPDVDIVLMDWMMPVMDGIEATRELRAHEDTNDLPVVTMTAKDSEEDRRTAIAAGANEFISKPVRPNQLLETIQRLVGRVA